MAHFAKVNDQNIVEQVIVINNTECLENGIEIESKGAAFCQNLFGGVWIQTSYNGNIRKNFAGIGYTYDSTRNAFIPPKPYSSWLLNEDTCKWEAPVPYPSDNNEYYWDETTTSWKLVE